MRFSDERVLVILIVGALVGFLASRFLRGSGLGVVGDGAVGIVGALLGDWILPRFHIHVGGGVMALAVNAAIGAILTMLVVRVSGASGWGAGR